MDHSSAEQSIFLAALERNSGGDRETYLNQACGDNSELRAEIEALLAANGKSGDLLDVGVVGCVPTADLLPVVEGPGTHIGPYKLLQKLGEGGMGVVYMAEQKEPVRRRVALKIIKPGMDSQQVLARFEAERQALAMMDHPNIARVLGAGMTDSARPYFTMDLVKGIPITDYCDEHCLSASERLELFIPVCRALQHAHQKGIVHRDVKPTNVLVAEFDNQAVPKIIDFGVAKAIDQQLTERTLFTQFGQVVGTPEYMSPEQAKLNQLDVDTRSDIYSLGVLLYELLTGVTPFDKQRLRSAAFEELLRIIREEDPPRPSVRLSTVDELPMVATKRKSEPRKLSVLLRGELDWLVMKAMDKERSRRYDSASALADDVQRYLSGDPVVACPPSRSYLFRKFAGRHGTAIGTTTVVFGALLLGIVGTSWMAVKASQSAAAAVKSSRIADNATVKAEVALKIADAERVKAERALAQLCSKHVEQALLMVMSGDFRRTPSAIRAAQTAGAREEVLEVLNGLSMIYQGNVNEAVRRLEKAVESNPNSVLAHSALAVAFHYSGSWSRRAGPMEVMDQRGITPKTDYEKLLFAHTKSLGSVFSGGTYDSQLNELIDAHPSWALARAIRAEVAVSGLNLPQNTLEQASADITWAREALRDSPYAITVDLWVHHMGGRTLDASSELAVDFRKRAESAAAELDRFPDYLFGRLVRGTYYQVACQDETVASNDFDAAIAMGAGGSIYRALDLFGSGRTQQALELLQDDDSASWVLRVFLEAETHGFDAAWDSYRSGSSKHAVFQLHALWMLRLAGEAPEPIAKAMGELPNAQMFLKFFIGETGEESLIDGATSDWGRLQGHYLAALRCLTNGKRKEASDHFDYVMDHFNPFTPFCFFTRVFRERLKQDENWPASGEHGTSS